MLKFVAKYPKALKKLVARCFHLPLAEDELLLRDCSEVGEHTSATLDLYWPSTIPPLASQQTFVCYK